MDLLSIVNSLWRYKLFTIPVVVLTAIMGLYVVKIKPPVYDATSSVLLSNPQAQASESQIIANPSLRKVSPFNTFVSYGDLRVAANAVMDLVTSGSAQPALLNAGAGSRYQLALSSDYGNPPIIQITGVGSSPQAAILSANVLTSAIKTNLYQLQQKEGINPFYMITLIQLVKPDQAQRSTSGKLRSVIAVLALGGLLLFVVVSVADALEKRRRDSSSNTGTLARLRKDNPRFQRTAGIGREPNLVNGSGSRRTRSREPLV
jgi:hypothetical protein